MRRLFALAFALSTVGAAGQADNVDGLVAVAQCYTACSLNRHRSLENIAEATIALDTITMSQKDWESHLCSLAELHVEGNDACYYGCVDIEKATGLRTSLARTRFITQLRRDRKLLEEAGLWKDYRSVSETWFGSPEFETACDAFFKAGKTASNGASSKLLNALQAP